MSVKQKNVQRSGCHASDAALITNTIARVKELASLCNCEEGQELRSIVFSFPPPREREREGEKERGDDEASKRHVKLFPPWANWKCETSQDKRGGGHVTNLFHRDEVKNNNKILFSMTFPAAVQLGPTTGRERE